MKAIFRWLSCLAFVIMCGQLLAHSTEKRISELEQQMQEVGGVNPQDTFGTDFTTASPQVENGWCLMVEPLYWHAKVGATEYAFTDTTRTFNSLSSVLISGIKGRVKDQEFGWEWGLRFAIGRQFNSDHWDVSANYTWYQADDSTNVFKDFPSSVVSLRLPDASAMKAAKSHYDLNYNNVNLELGRHYFMSGKTSIRPQVGLKTTWIFARQIVQYTFPNDGLEHPGFNIKSKDKSILWGMGPRMGVEAEGYIGDGLSLYGKLTGALLYSYFRASYLGSADQNATIIGDDFKIHYKGNAHLFVPTAQMMLGMIWKTYMNEHRQHLTLGAGYEVEYYWRANQMLMVDDTQLPGNTSSRRLNVDRSSEDIMFYGLTLKARLDF